MGKFSIPHPQSLFEFKSSHPGTFYYILISASHDAEQPPPHYIRISTIQETSIQLPYKQIPLSIVFDHPPTSELTANTSRNIKTSTRGDSFS